MSHILILYATTEGQTQHIGEHMAPKLEAMGHAVTLMNVKHVPAQMDWDAIEGVIAGASVHVGRHQHQLEQFVQEHLDELTARPGAFFSVSLSAHGPTDQQHDDAHQYVAGFEEKTGWHPALTATFAGALRYTAYGLPKRLLMKWITKRGGSGDTDTHRDYEYTDWAAVDRFAEEFAHRLPTPRATETREEGAARDKLPDESSRMTE